MNAIEIEGVEKEFVLDSHSDKIHALHDITFRVAAGQVMGLLGPNGSGKTTLLKIALGLLPPTRGTCRIFGSPNCSAEARIGVAYLPEATECSPYLTGFEYVYFHARLSGLPRIGLETQVQAAIERVGLQRAMHRRIGTYSKGMRQRIGLAQVLALNPRLAILDEPTSGLDPLGTQEIILIIKELQARGATILLSSHLLEQMEAICDEVVLLDQGRIVRQGRVDELTRLPPRQAVLVDALSAQNLQDLQSWLRTRGIGFLGIETPRRQLERVFFDAVEDAVHPDS